MWLPKYGSVVENLPADAGDVSLIPGLGRSPGEGNGNPLPVFLLGEFHGQRSLVDYSPSGCRRVGHNRATKQQTNCIESCEFLVI